MAARVSGGSESLSVHSTGWPDLAAQPAAGIANSGLSAGAISTASVGSPATSIWKRVDRLGERGRARALDRLHLPVLGLRRVADPDHLRAVGLLGARRRELLERLLAGGRQLAAVREQHGRLQRARHQLGGGDRRAPVVLLDDHHGARAALVRAGGVDGARGARGVGDRIAARHARRVLGGEDREAERGRVLGLLLVAARAEDGLRVAAAVARSDSPPSPPPPQPAISASRRTGRRRRSTAIKLATRPFSATVARRPLKVW